MTENLFIADASLIIVNNYDYDHKYLESIINGKIVPLIKNISFPN